MSVRYTVAARDQLDELLRYYDCADLLPAARKLLESVRAAEAMIVASHPLAVPRPDLTDLPFLWLRQHIYLFAFLPDASGYGFAGPVITNVINATWDVARHVRSPDAIVLA